jgi:predicted nuclease of predicted toxin-antitoxin system
MKLIFDENTPFSLARDLDGHDCSSVIKLGWRGTENGQLLSRAEHAGFDVLVTLDDDIEKEQNMAGRRIAILVVKPAEQGKQAMRMLAPVVLDALTEIRPGEIRVIGP